MLSTEIKKQVSISLTLGSNSENNTFETELSCISEEDFSKKVEIFARSKVLVTEKTNNDTVLVIARIVDSDIEKSISIKMPASREEIEEITNNWLDRLINYSVTLN